MDSHFGLFLLGCCSIFSSSLTLRAHHNLLYGSCSRFRGASCTELYVTSPSSYAKVSTDTELFHQSAGQNDIEMISRLLQSNVDLSFPDSNGDTALHIAIKASNYETVQLLISHGSPLLHRNKLGHNCLDIAFGANKIEETSFFIESVHNFTNGKDIFQTIRVPGEQCDNVCSFTILMGICD